MKLLNDADLRFLERDRILGRRRPPPGILAGIRQNPGSPASRESGHSARVDTNGGGPVQRRRARMANLLSPVRSCSSTRCRRTSG
jgi:hypothetical protein